MDEDRKSTQKLPDSAECRELVRDWELLFWTFLLFGVGRLLWLSLAASTNRPFQLGISCGFLFCGILGFLMRLRPEPRIEKQKDGRA